MLEDLESYEDIVRLSDRLLRTAGAYGRFPTPVEDILAAAELEEASDTFLSESSIAMMPAHLRGVLRRVRQGSRRPRPQDAHSPREPSRRICVGQKAFKRLHETSHDLFPWQHIDEGRNGFADSQMTLSGRTTIIFEREANQGAAELLFQRDRFTEMAGDYAIGCATIIELGEPVRCVASRNVPSIRRIASRRARRRSPRSSALRARTTCVPPKRGNLLEGLARAVRRPRRLADHPAVGRL